MGQARAGGALIKYVGSETLIAFRAYSRYDLERMFSVGMDGAAAGQP